MTAMTNINYAHELLDDLRQRYLQEFPDRINEIEESVLALENALSLKEAQQNLYRILHSTKGTAGTFGLPAITKICHHTEEILVMSSAGETVLEKDSIDAFLEYIDLMRQAHSMAIQGVDNTTPIDTQLERIKQRFSSAAFRGLIVETSRTYANLYLKLFNALPIDFTVIDNGIRALERLMEDRFDVLITGQATPGLNGTALISAVRLSESQNEHIQSILVTSSRTRPLPTPIAPNYIVQKDKMMADTMLSIIGNITSSTKHIKQ